MVLKMSKASCWAKSPAPGKSTFYGSSASELKRDGKQLSQAANDNEPEQVFDRAAVPVPEGAPIGASFERALYSAYMGGSWKILSGPGEGNTVQFQADGQVAGLPGADRYALCLAGDCASMSGGNDNIWLQANGQGNTWIFARKGKELEIFPDREYRTGGRDAFVYAG